MNKKILLILLVTVFILTGCATRTRIGALIPTHHLSNHRLGEEIWLHISKISSLQDEELEKQLKEVNTNCKETLQEFAGAAALSSIAIGMAIDYVKSELQEEAKSYEASYGAKAWLTTKDLWVERDYKTLIKNMQDKKTLTNVCKTTLEKFGSFLNRDIELKKQADIENNNSDVVILLSRWVDESAFSSSPDEKEYREVIQQIEKITVNSNNIIPAKGSTRLFESTNDFNEAIKGKKLAFAYALSIDRGDSESSNSPFLVKPIWKWQWLSKAKVVDFRPPLSPRALLDVLALPAALFLKTGSELDYNVRLSIDFLAFGETDDGKNILPQMVSLGLKDAITGPAKHDLSGNKQLIKYYEKNPPIVGWLVIPGYPDLKSTGYFSLQLTVNESDPSNVKKTILKGSDYLDANRDNLINKLNPIN